jgi:hypothetical protein
LYILYRYLTSSSCLLDLKFEMDFHHFCSYVHDIEQEQADRGASKFI